jgi:hypothetical protein
MPDRDLWHKLSAVRTTLCRQGNIAEALRACLGGGQNGRGCGGGEFLDHILHRHNDREIDCGCDEQEVDQRVEQLADVDIAWSYIVSGQRAGRRWHAVQRRDMNDQGGEVRRTDKGGDQRGDDVGSDRCGDGSKGGSDNDRNSQIDDVPAKDEIPKSFEHVSISLMPRCLLAHPTPTGWGRRREARKVRRELENCRREWRQEKKRDHEQNHEVDVEQ